MDLRISFPGGKRVNASFDGYVVATDQPVSGGGEGSAPGPFDLFLASLGTCAGIYVLGFCQARGLATDGIEIVERVTFDAETHLPSLIRIEVDLPASFPEKYRAAVRRVAEQCKVKKVLAAPPQIEVDVTSRAVAEQGVADVSSSAL